MHASPATLWRRCLAALVDLIAVGSVVSLYFTVAAAVTGAAAPASNPGGLDGLMQQLHAWHALLLPGAVLAAVLALTYTAVFAFLWEGRTLGRWLLGIRLVDLSGHPPTPTRAVARAALSALSFVLLLGGYWLALFDRRGQTLHDKLTSTFVVRLGLIRS